MNPKSQITLAASAIAAATTFIAATAPAAPEAAPQEVGSTCFRARHGTEVVSRDGDPVLVRSLGTYGWPGVEIRVDETGGTWDWSNVGEIRVTVSNGSDRAEQIYAAVVGEGMSLDVAPTFSSRVPPHSARTLVIPIADDAYVTDGPVEFAEGENMRGQIEQAKGSSPFAKTERVDVFWYQSSNPHAAEMAVQGVETAHPARIPQVVPAATFFPFVDKYGQFKHADWPGKIHSDEDFATQRAEEEAWLAAHPGSPTPDVDEFGGWEGGPKLEATGFFRTEKVNGKWWFVDPKGHLFFSIGIDCLYAGSGTIVTGRERYFEGPLDSGLYTNKGSGKREMTHIAANLRRKYGEGWRNAFSENVHARFKAWGINTIGNWSSADVRLLRRTPYVATIDFSSKTEWPKWGKKGGRNMPDVDSPKFAADLRERAGRLAAEIGDDPWCLGVFVDNEMGWNGCGDEAGEVAEKYYSTVRAVLKEILPNHLYLGSRLHFAPESVWAASARHCDVVSNNFYEYEPSYDIPDGAPDKPIIIGEFHFGAKDRGYFTASSVAAYDQKERAECFKHYVRACLDNPRYVGCHWFQYQDQPVSGREDGENYNDGFVTVCDVPYPEMVEASREVAAELYTRRFSNR